MFSVIYTFVIKDGLQEEFVQAWTGLTQLIYMHEGSLGSRLHQKDESTFVAYAQWPDKETWENSGKKLPEEADVFRGQMRSACELIETNAELEVVKDLIKNHPFNG